jgi:hypothetical protein
MDIPAHLVDPTTLVKNHTMYTHLGCVALRCVLGLFFLLRYKQSTNENIAFVSLFGVLLVFFLYKFFRVKSWKVFLRTVITLALSIILMLTAEKETAGTAVGLLLIVDGLMGLQSRYTATLL